MEDEQGERILAVPFEVKTGRNSTNASHRAQTALYTLLLSDRYGASLRRNPVISSAANALQMLMSFMGFSTIWSHPP